MTNPLDTLPRNQRRRLLRAELEARKSGHWGEWRAIDLRLSSTEAKGWLKQCHTAWRNSVFCVLERESVNGTRHLAISSLSGNRPSWHDMQRIKNEIAGITATAVEVYPPAHEVVDGANMYHLWVLPEPLEFGLCEQDKP